MKLFGNTVKFLLAQRRLTGKELAKRVNLSETSVSKIVNGVTKPRQANLTRIMQELCETPEEEQQLISAYFQIQDTLKNEQRQADSAAFERLENGRARRYLRVKSQNVAFRRVVAVALDQADISFQGLHQNKEVICDFFIPGTPSIAIDCKSDPTHDWDRTIASARLFLTELPCDQVAIVVPSLEAISNIEQKCVRAADLHLIELSKIVEFLSK